MNQHEKARAFIKRHRLRREEVSELTGYSKSAVLDFLNGESRTKPPRPIDPKAFKRFRLALGAVTHGLKDWEFED